MKLLIKIDRISAWILLVGILLYFISGFGMVKGFISPLLASKIHLSYLTYIVATAFVVHTSFAISLAMRRWGWWILSGKLGLVMVYLMLMVGLIYANNYHRNTVATTVNIASSSSSATAADVISSQKIFSLKELAQYDGQNGQPAYVAVDGVIYDLTSVFRSGTHFGYQAGQDLSSAFHQQHSTNILSRYPIVGKLAS